MKTILLTFFALATLSLSGCGDDDDDTAVILGAAEQAASKGKHIDAVLQLKTLLAENPKETEARVALGKIYTVLGDPQQAAKEFERAISADTTEPQTYQLWLSAKNDAGQSSDVLNWFKQPKQPDLGALGRVIKAQAEWFNGLRNHKDFIEVLDEVASDPSARRAASVAKVIVLTRYKPEAALKLTTATRQEFPDDIHALMAAAGAALTNQDFEASKQLFQEAVDRVPRNAYARVGLIQAALRLKDAGLAEEQMPVITASFTNSPMISLLQAQIEWIREDVEQADFHVRRFLSRVPDSPDGLRLLAYVMSSKQLYQQAKENLETYISIRPKDDSSRIRLASTLRELGAVREGIDVLVAGTELDGASSTILQAAGLALVRVGDRDRGLALLRYCVKRKNWNRRIQIRSSE